MKHTSLLRLPLLVLILLSIVLPVGSRSPAVEAQRAPTTAPLREVGSIDCYGRPGSGAAGAVAIHRLSETSLQVDVTISNGQPNASFSIELWEANPDCYPDNDGNTGSVITTDTNGNGAKTLFVSLPYPSLGGTTLGDRQGTESLVIALDSTLSQGAGDTYATEPMLLPEPCEVSPTTGLDECLLEPGDILFVRGQGLVENFIKLGSWWSHVALYAGNGKIIQAINDPDLARNVELIDIRQSDWWRSNADTYVMDWQVRRPNVSEAVRRQAVADALIWTGGPELPYQVPIQDLTPLEDESRFYCSKLVWRAYNRNGFNLDATRWPGMFGYIDPVVTPGDLDNQRSTLIQRKTLTKERRQILATPLVGAFQGRSESQLSANDLPAVNVRIMLVDPQGRRSGYDPVSRAILNEIPDVLYEGAGTVFENLSGEGVGEGWSVRVTGVEAGEYQLGVSVIGSDGLTQQIIGGRSFPGQVQAYKLRSSEAGDGTLLVASNVLYLPLTLR